MTSRARPRRPAAAAGPASPAQPGAYAHAFAAARAGLPELVPANPAVDADDDEEDLPAGLAPQVELLGGVERATEAAPRKTVNNNTLPTMPIGHAATLRRMPSRALAKPKPFPMISRQKMPGPMSIWAFSNRASSSEKSMVILHSSGRTNAGV